MDFHLSLVLVALLCAIGLVEMNEDCDDKEGICHPTKYSCKSTIDEFVKKQPYSDDEDCRDVDRKCNNNKYALYSITHKGECCDVLNAPIIAHCSYEREECPISQQQNHHYICVPTRFRVFNLKIFCPGQKDSFGIVVNLPICCGCKCCKEGVDPR